MSSEEKRVWVYAAVAFGVPVVYFAVVLGRLANTEAAEIAYVRPMLIAVGAALVLNMLFPSKKADRKDERDANIHRRGEHVGFYVLAAGAAVALGLTMSGFDHFWIANTIYLAFILNALTSSIVKILAYRRGF